MTKYKTINAFFEEESPKDIVRFVDKNLEISEQIHEYLKERGWSQSDFAKELGKSKAEISKWLSGNHNLTLRSIAKMEAILDKDIILTKKAAEEQYKKVQYISINCNIYQSKNYNVLNQYYCSNKKSKIGAKKFSSFAPISFVDEGQLPLKKFVGSFQPQTVNL